MGTYVMIRLAMAAALVVLFAGVMLLGRLAHSFAAHRSHKEAGYTGQSAQPQVRHAVGY